MGESTKKPRLGVRLVRGLTDIRDAIKSGEPLSKKFTVRKVVLDLEPEDFDAKAIRDVRESLGVSQALFAQILGASVDTVASWEQGIRVPTPMARRLLEEICRNKQHWRKILRKSVTTIEA